MKQANIVQTNFADAKDLLLPRDPEGHKGTFGHGLLIAGSRGMAGAAILGARAALRSGMGKLTVHTAGFNLPLLQTAVPEAIVSADKQTEAVSTLPHSWQQMQAVAIGPGLGQSTSAKSLLEDLLAKSPDRLVIDADGLNLLATIPDWPSLAKGAILTPHPGEWQRLAAAIKAAENNPQEAAGVCAERYSIYIIMKGHRTTIFTPQGIRFVNTTGNCGMATAGSGDVLTGILLSLLAQGYEAEQACRLGVWLHGKAGDIAAERLSTEAMIASDIIEHLPGAFRTLKIEN